MSVRYTEDHEWLREQDGEITVGITRHASEQLGDVVFIELPQVGVSVQAGDEFGEVESVKAVSSLYSPVSGEVVEVNNQLPEQPEMLNEDPYVQGWIAKVRVSDEGSLAKLLDYAAYQKQCDEEG